VSVNLVGIERNFSSNIRDCTLSRRRRPLPLLLEKVNDGWMDGYHCVVFWHEDCNRADYIIIMHSSH
jgi:hypothetical protein